MEHCEQVLDLKLKQLLTAARFSNQANFLPLSIFHLYFDLYWCELLEWDQISSKVIRNYYSVTFKAIVNDEHQSV